MNTNLVAEDDFMVMLTMTPNNFARIIELSKDNEKPYTMDGLDRAWQTNQKANKIGFVTFTKPKAFE